VAAAWRATSAPRSRSGSPTSGAPRSGAAARWTRSSAMMLVDDDGGDVRDVAESECPSCRRLFCARCAVAPWHAGVTRAEYKGLRKEDRGKEDMLLLEMAKGRKWKRCPKCEFFVEKRDGCLHITCRYAVLLLRPFAASIVSAGVNVEALLGCCNFV